MDRTTATLNLRWVIRDGRRILQQLHITYHNYQKWPRVERWDNQSEEWRDVPVVNCESCDFFDTKVHSCRYNIELTYDSECQFYSEKG